MKKQGALQTLKEAEELFGQGRFLEAIIKYKIVIQWMSEVIKKISK